MNRRWIPIAGVIPLGLNGNIIGSPTRSEGPPSPVVTHLLAAAGLPGGETIARDQQGGSIIG